MKTSDLVGRAVEAGSRAHLARAVLVRPDGTPRAYLPVAGGRIRGEARPGDRWSATLTLPGDAYTPTHAAHPLAGFTGERVRLDLGARFDDRDEWVAVCELIVNGCQVERDRDDYALDVTLEGLAAYLDSATDRAYTPKPGETVGQMIRRIVSDTVPASWAGVGTVDDRSTGSDTPVPSDYESGDAGGWQIIETLCAVGNVTAYVDAAGTLVVRDPLPATPSTPARTLDAADDLTAYRLVAGRSRSFANRVEFTCTRDTGDPVVGIAEHTAGPTGSGAIGRRTLRESRYTGSVSQTTANRRAAAILAVVRRGWFTVEAQALPDPRLEPDDDVDIVYLDGQTVAHRITALDLPLGTTTMRLALRTFDDPMPATLGD